MAKGENATKVATEQTNGKTKDEGEEEKKEGPALPPIGLIELFKFATPMDTFLILSGLFMAFICGSAMPVFTIFFGTVLQVSREP